MDQSTNTSQKKSKPTPVKIAKLSSGESILCLLLGMDETSLLCKDPLKIISMPNGEYVNYGLTPFIEMGDTNKVIIGANHVVSIMNANQDAVVMYGRFLEAQKRANMQKDESRSKPQKGGKPTLVYENKDHPYFSKDRDKVYPMLIEDDDPKTH